MDEANTFRRGTDCRPQSTPICFAELRGYAGFGIPPLPDPPEPAPTATIRENTSAIFQTRVARLRVDVVGRCCGTSDSECAETHYIGVFSGTITRGECACGTRHESAGAGSSQSSTASR